MPITMTEIITIGVMLLVFGAYKLGKSRAKTVTTYKYLRPKIYRFETTEALVKKIVKDGKKKRR